MNADEWNDLACDLEITREFEYISENDAPEIRDNSSAYRNSRYNRKRRPALILSLCALTLTAWCAAAGIFMTFRRAGAEFDTALENRFFASANGLREELTSLAVSLDGFFTEQTGGGEETRGFLINAFSEVSASAAAGQAFASATPLDEDARTKLRGFFSLASDYAVYSLRKLGAGETFNEYELRAAVLLRDYAVSVSSLISDRLDRGVYAGGVSLSGFDPGEIALTGEIFTEASNKTSPVRSVRLSYPPDNDEETPDFASGGLDGLRGRHITEEDDARSAAAHYMTGLTLAEVRATGGGSTPQVYRYGGRNSFIEFAVSGGFLLRFARARPVAAAAVSTEEAVAAAKIFLRRAGYAPEVLRAVRTEGGVCYFQGETKDGGDFVIGCGLDSGSVMFFDGYGIFG